MSAKMTAFNFRHHIVGKMSWFYRRFRGLTAVSTSLSNFDRVTTPEAEVTVVRWSVLRRFPSIPHVKWSSCWIWNPWRCQLIHVQTVSLNNELDIHK